MKRKLLVLILFSICIGGFAQLNINITSTDTYPCFGMRPVLTANVNGGIPPYSYHWSDNSTNSSDTIAPVIVNHNDYSVTVTDSNSDSISAYINFPVDTLHIDSIQIIHHGDTAELIPYFWSNTVVSWTWGWSSLNMPFTFSPFMVIDTVQTTFCLIIASSNGCTDTLCVTSTPVRCCSVSVFPNPATNKLNITLSGKSEIKIFNFEGLLMKSFVANNGKINLDISTLLNGIYLIEVKTEKGIAVKKFVKE